MVLLQLLPLLLFLKPALAQDCDASDPFSDGCDDSAPAIATDGLLTLCSETLDSCPGGFPAAQSCVTTYCQLGCGDTNNCCSSSNPQSCFESSSGTSSSGSDNGGSGAAASSLPAGAAMCTSIAAQLSSCESATPGFSTLANSAQALCFCFDKNGSYDGTVWDMAASTCYQAMQAESQSASELSAFESVVVGACTKFVDAGVLSSAGAKTGAAASMTGSTSKAVVAAKTTAKAAATAATAGAKAGTSSSSSTTAPTAIAKSGAVMKRHDMRVGGLLSGICIFIGLLL